MNTKLVIIISVLSIVLGLVLGRGSAPESAEPEIEYVKGDTVFDSIPYPVPYKVEVPVYPELPTKIDTFYGDTVRVVEVVDTAAIIACYIEKRKYTNTLFDNDSVGSLTVNADVQYNLLTGIAYTFVPITKEVTNTSVRKVIPFLSASYTTLGCAGIGGGLFIKDIGVEAKFVSDGDRNGFEFGVKKSF